MADAQQQSIYGHMPLKWPTLGAMALLILLNVALISWSVASIPVRGVLAVSMLGLFALIAPQHVVDAFKRHSEILLLTAAFALLGTFVSLVNGDAYSVILRTIMEVHVQIAITLLVATVAAKLAGTRASALVFVACIGVTALVAVMQFLEIDWGWRLREILGSFQGEVMSENTSLINHRPMGLSYSPIHLATQLCLAFAVYTATCSGMTSRKPERPLEMRMIVAALVLIFVAVVCATRSPILGAVLFLCAFMASRSGILPILLIGATGVLLYFAGPEILNLFRDAQPRVARLDDDSAMGRISLYTFGLLLLRDNPVGYGFGFVPSEHWMTYWHQLYTLQSADDIQSKELHNYILNMLCTYGIGIVLLLPWIWRLLSHSWRYAIFFLPYAVHILFHNSGPFWNDTLIWFVIGIISSSADTVAQDMSEGIPSRRASSGAFATPGPGNS